MMESFSVNEVKLWLLDHAVKHDMQSVIKYIFQDRSTIEHLFKKISDPNSQNPEARPTSLFLLILEHLKESLQIFQELDGSQSFPWDKQALNLTINLLDTAYQEKHFVDFLQFMKLLKLLKLMAIFRMLYENDGGQAICAELNLHFPHWNADVRRKLKQAYGDESDIYADDIKETNTDTRKFILMLVINSQRRKIYLQKNFAGDMKKMVQKTLPLLDVVITAVKEFIGPSTVEQIISYTDENLLSSNDPAVQIILEYLKPDMTAQDFIELLQILEPADSQEDNIRFDAPIEQLFLECGSPQVSGQNSNTVNDNTTLSSGDNPNTILDSHQNQYGPLGLFPPSAKKTAEEVSEIQAAQERMELVMDSEDEEEVQ